MSSTTPKTLWSEQEKVTRLFPFAFLVTNLALEMALMMSIIAASGPPNWSCVVLPAGRSRIACTSLYNRLVKEASTIPSADGAKAGTTPKRTPKKTKENGTPTKRKRGSKGDDMATEDAHDDDGEDTVVKKQKKVDEKSEEEQIKQDEDMVIKEEEEVVDEEVVDGEDDHAVEA